MRSFEGKYLIFLAVCAVFGKGSPIQKLHIVELEQVFWGRRVDIFRTFTEHPHVHFFAALSSASLSHSLTLVDTEAGIRAGNGTEQCHIIP